MTSPETRLTSRELAAQIALLYVTDGETYIYTVKAAALIDAWVRVREASLSTLIEKWRRPVASSTAQNEAVYNHCADDLEVVLTTDRKQLLEEKKGEPT